jgi:hypothetical protein
MKIMMLLGAERNAVLSFQEISWKGRMYIGGQ